MCKLPCLHSTKKTTNSFVATGLCVNMLFIWMPQGWKMHNFKHRGRIHGRNWDKSGLELVSNAKHSGNWRCKQKIIFYFFWKMCKNPSFSSSKHFFGNIEGSVGAVLRTVLLYRWRSWCKIRKNPKRIVGGAVLCTVPENCWLCRFVISPIGGSGGGVLWTVLEGAVVVEYCEQS